MKRIITTTLSLCIFLLLGAQSKDTLFNKQLDDVVVTANRSERNKGNIAVPVTLVSQKQIFQTGSLRLQNILEEQTGLAVVNSPLSTSLNGYPNPFGQGIQLLGLDPAYTSILLDGEPLVGRNAGILKLGRLATGNIRQVEIVKGPSSSLYGSEAMAGVINILTEYPQKENISVQLHGASNETYGMSGSYGNKFANTVVQAFANYYSSNGYDLDPNLYGKTVDPYRNYSLQAKLISEISPRDKFTLSVRNFHERQNNNYEIIYQGNLSVVKGHTDENDLSAFAQWLHKPAEKTKWYLRTFFNTYSNNAFVNLDKTDIRFDETTFKQYIVKPEIQFEKNKDHSRYVAGLGVNIEMIDASRYAGKKDLHTFYAFTQKEWYFNQKKWTLIAGGRIDKRTDFDLRVSPHIAVAYQPDEHWKWTASAGLGFKAPDFRHMYLSFNNAQIGYSLIGANVLSDELFKLQQQGLIADSIDLNPYRAIKNLNPETSFGIHTGLKYQGKYLQADIGIFRNDVNDLIDNYLLPVTKTNGGNIYSYRNIRRIYTQGIEFNAATNILHPFRVSIGYQFLESADKDVLDEIKAGKLYSRDPVTYDVTLLKRKNYGGLFNRSKHSGNIKLEYDDEKHGWNAYIRMVYRGRFGYTDINGNGVADIDAEYVKSFWIGNISASKNLHHGVTIQAGVENLLGYTNAAILPQYAGRLFFVNLNCNLGNLISKK